MEISRFAFEVNLEFIKQKKVTAVDGLSMCITNT